MSRNLTLTIAAAALVLIGAAVWFANKPSVTLENQTKLAELSNIQQTAATETAGADMVVKEMVLGSEDAPVTVYEYASFTCPHCANFHRDVFPRLKSEYIDTGKVRFVYREVYFDRLGLWGGLLARCSDDRYFGVSDLLYKRQNDWTKGEDATTILQNLYAIGRVAGLQDAQMETCMTDSAHAEALVAAFQKNSEEHGINSTPSLVIDGKNIGNVPYGELSTLLDKELGN